MKTKSKVALAAGGGALALTAIALLVRYARRIISDDSGLMSVSAAPHGASWWPETSNEGRLARLAWAAGWPVDATDRDLQTDGTRVTLDMPVPGGRVMLRLVADDGNDTFQLVHIADQRGRTEWYPDDLPAAFSKLGLTYSEFLELDATPPPDSEATP